MNDETTPSNQSAAPEGGALVTLPTPPSGGPQRAGRGLGITALVLAAGAGMAAAYLWQGLEQTRARDAATTVLLSQQIEALKATDARQSDSLAQSRRDIDAAAEQRQALKAAVDDLRDRVARDRSDWVMAEADYLLIMANRRLRFERDVPAAIAALEEADGRIQSLNEPALTPVRAAIAGELVALRAIPSVDRSGLALQLSGLMHAVDSLPLSADLSERPAGSAPHPAVARPSVTGWREFFAAMWSDIRGLVTVRRRDQPVEPLLPPEQRYFLGQNLTLKLETARLALLQRDPGIYLTALQEAQVWTQRYYNTEAPQVEAFIGGLTRLQQAPIASDLPDVSGSLRVLRRTVRELTPRRSGADT